MKREYSIGNQEEFASSIRDGLDKERLEEVTVTKYYSVNGGLIVPNSQRIKNLYSVEIYGTSPQHIIEISKLLRGLNNGN